MNAPADDPVVAWVSANVIPFEAELRVRLRRLCNGPAEVDDLIQDVYHRILQAGSLDHILEPRAFLMQTAKNILIDRYRRDAIVRIDAVANLDELNLADPVSSTERIALGRAELKWALGLVASLPERCRNVFSARKIYGMSQHETAESLGITENVVEKEMTRGMRMLAELVKTDGIRGDAPAIPPKPSARPSRKRHV